MVKKLWAFAVDFWRDGNALLGVVAAPLSIAFTPAKAFDVPALSHPRDISYAWALAPILLWVFVAYVRLRARTAKNTKRETLKAFYISGGPLISRRLKKETTSEADFDSYIAEVDAWVNSCADWIEQNMGLAARERFMDRTGMIDGLYAGAIRRAHSNAIANLTRFRQNLLVLIESNAWD